MAYSKNNKRIRIPLFYFYNILQTKTQRVNLMITSDEWNQIFYFLHSFPFPSLLFPSFASLHPLFLSFPLSSCSHVTVSVCCTCLCVHMKSSQEDIRCHILLIPAPCPQGLSLWARLLNSEFPGIYLCLPKLSPRQARTLHRCKGFELRASCLHNKCLYSPSHFP